MLIIDKCIQDFKKKIIQCHCTCNDHHNYILRGVVHNAFLTENILVEILNVWHIQLYYLNVIRVDSVALDVKSFT